MRRVVITGTGAVSPLGLTAEASFEGFKSARSGVDVIRAFDASSFPCGVAGSVPAFKAAEFVPKSYRKSTKIMARDIELAVVAADNAVRDARLATRGILESTGGTSPDNTWYAPDPSRVGCNIGAGLICADLNELTEAMARAANPDNTLNLARWGKSDNPNESSGMDALAPLWLLKYLPNMLSCHVSIIHDTRGPSNTITCQQASAGLAMAEACRTIQRDQADVALVGGGESLVHPMGLMRWTKLHLLNRHANGDPSKACRPYDKNCAGTVIAEGAGVLVIEELEHARRRGAHIYAEIKGLSSCASGLPLGTADLAGEPLKHAALKAIADAGLKPDDISLLMPPASALPHLDQSDAMGIRSAFGRVPPLTTPRGAMGDAGAASQAIDLVLAAQMLDRREICPSLNSDQPLDGLSVVTHAAPAVDMRNILVLARSLAGQHSAILLSRYQETE
jgi:3-oxoacyl-[acyl-carrier-protein] synthase II